jgi:TonB family protein
MRLCSYGLCACLAALPAPVCAQSQPPQPISAAAPTASTPTLDYPDSPAGLERLVKEILRAQRENDAARADFLLRSFVLPSPREWYPQVFGNQAGSVAAYYERFSPMIAPHLAQALLQLDTSGATEIHAQRFENSCDDAASVNAFSTLRSRVQPIPLYELRLVKGADSARIFPIVYVGGAFRFVLPPDTEIPSQPRAQEASEKLQPEVPDGSDDPGLLKIDRITQEAKLTHRVAPAYPSIAVAENLQGEVLLQVVLNKDGTVREIRDVQGPCSLAKSAVEAVRQWRYSPTVRNGSPVEVLTEISVDFHLNQ